MKQRKSCWNFNKIECLCLLCILLLFSIRKLAARCFDYTDRGCLLYTFLCTVCAPCIIFHILDNRCIQNSKTKNIPNQNKLVINISYMYKTEERIAIMSLHNFSSLCYCYKRPCCACVVAKSVVNSIIFIDSNYADYHLSAMFIL